MSIAVFHVGDQEDINRDYGWSDKGRTEPNDSGQRRTAFTVIFAHEMTDIEGWKHND